MKHSGYHRALIAGLLVLTGLGWPAGADLVRVDLPKLDGDGFGEFNVIGDTKDDTLLWRSDKLKDTAKLFRIWSLESDAYYALTYGDTDKDPGRVVAFCGFQSGQNRLRIDTAAIRSEWYNIEAPYDEEEKGKEKWRVNFKPIQGEFDKLFELFRFDFVAKDDKVKMSHQRFNADVTAIDGKYKKEWDGGSLVIGANVTKDIKASDLFKTFESDTHKWNPKPYKDILDGKEKLTGVDPDDDGAWVDAIAAMQDPDGFVPAPGSLSLALAGIPLAARCRRRG
ncbi:MAG: hypothetical protein IT435_02145 [Phycisphaerales bacterium]|nr:hypothetical protein [Phycisphaerales bacterium]